MVCPLSVSLALYTTAVDDFANSLRISKWPSFVDISFFQLHPIASPSPSAAIQVGSADPGEWVGLGYRCPCKLSSYQGKRGTPLDRPVRLSFASGLPRLTAPPGGGYRR